jgi:hypothetical protein
MNLVNRGRSWGVFICAIAVILLLSANVAYGQGRYATITGRVLDPKGASVPDAQVTAMNVDTGIARTTTTTSEGLYRFEELVPGTYDVTVGSASFTKAIAKGVKILVGESRDVNFNLELAGQRESVVVTSEIPLVETTKTDVSINLDDRDVANLPTTTSFAGLGGVSNDWQGLAYAAPGVRADYTGNLGNEVVAPGSVNDRGVVHNVDGGDLSDVSTSARDSLGASLEEVKEFEVITNNYNAEYGQAGSLILNVITKSGTNAIHGDGHAYFRGRNMGASDFFYNQTSCDPTLGTGPGSCDNKLDAGFPINRAPFYKHEYGFTAGGPFIKDRLFWFGTLEQVQTGSPTTTTPFGNSITVGSPTTEIIWSGKIDAKLTDKHTLAARFNVQRDLSDNAIVQTGGNVDPSGLVSTVAHDHTLNISLISTPTSHTVNEARFFWHHVLSQTPDKTTIPGQLFDSAYLGADFCCTQGTINNRFSYSDNVSWTHGAHTIKVGALINHLVTDSIFHQFQYGEFATFVAGPCTDAPFAQYPQAQGQCPTQFTIGLGAAFNHIPDNIYGVYAQDTWQLKRNLTMNAGLRYDLEEGAFTGGTITHSQNSQVPIGGCLQRNGIIPACGHDKNNVQPRLGFAWSPQYQNGFLHTLFGDPGRSVVRAAGGVVTELAYLNVVLDSLNFDGVSLLTTTADGTTPVGAAILSQFPNAPTSAQLSQLAATNPPNFFGRIRPISPTIKNPTIYNASLSITRQVGQTFVYSVGYVGVFGNGLFGETDQNYPKPIADPAHPGFFYVPPRPDPRFLAIRTNFSNRTSSYNGLMLTANKRLSHHFQFGANYTYSKTLGTGEDFYGVSEPGNPVANLGLDRAPVENDLRHLANFTFVTDTENLTGMRFVKNVVNNWTFGLIGTLQSGRAYPVSTGGGIIGAALPAIGAETNQRPNICNAVDATTIPSCAGAPVGALVATNIGSTSGRNLAVSESGVAACTAAGLANCAALQTTFLAPAGAATNGPVDSFTKKPVDFQFINGNLSRNAGISLPIKEFDISVLKAFKVPKRESMRVELKLDVFNVFNHPNFIGNNANDNISAIRLPALKTKSGAPNPNFNCTSLCVNPFTGLYLGVDGKPLTLSVFTSGRPDSNLNANFSNWRQLGDPAAGGATGGTVTPRIMQVAIRIRW